MKRIGPPFVCVFGAVLAFLVGTAGCMPTKKADSPGADASADAGDSDDASTPRKTIGETTQNVLELDQALADGGVPAETGVSSGNPLLQSAEAYRTTVAKVGGMAVQQAIRLRNAQSIQDPKPLSHQQFLDEIIRPGEPDGIKLPMLPYYQEYAWDTDAQELVVVDFPERKAARERSR